MQTVTELEIPRGKARSLISQFESQTSTQNNATGSVTEVSSKITQIEALIGTYTSYNRDKHVSLHSKIVDLLVGLNNETSKYNAYKLREVHATVKKLLALLDEKLPGGEVRIAETTKSEGKAAAGWVPNDPFKFIRSAELEKAVVSRKIEDEEREDVVDGVFEDPVELKITEKQVSVSALRGFFEKLVEQHDLDAQKSKPVTRSKSTTSLFDSTPKKDRSLGRSRSVSSLNHSQSDTNRYVPRFSVTNQNDDEEVEETPLVYPKSSDSGFEEKNDELGAKPSVYESATDVLTPHSSEADDEDDDYDEEEYNRMLKNNNIDTEPVEVQKRVTNYEEYDEGGSENDDYLSEADSLEDN